MSEFFPPVLTESGRVVKFSSDPAANTFVLELINGKWDEPSIPVSFDDDWNSRELSADELRSYME